MAGPRYTGQEAPPAPGTETAALSTFKREDTRTDPPPKKQAPCPEESVKWPTNETVERRSSSNPGY